MQQEHQERKRDRVTEFEMTTFRSGGSKRNGVFRVSSGLAAAIPGGIELRYAVAILDFFLKTRL